MSESIKIHILHCGQVQVDRAVPFKEKTIHPLPWTGLFRSSENRLWLPVSTYLIEHPKGLVVFDAGWPSGVRTDPVRCLGRLHYMASKPELKPGQAIHEQLTERGIKPSDVDYVVISHMDDDHAGGLQHLAEARSILVSKPEWISAGNVLNIRYKPGFWKGIQINHYNFKPSQVGPQKSAYDLFGDGSIMLVHTPGHSPGMTSMLIQANERFALLTGDAAYARKSWEQMISPGIVPEAEKAMASLKWIAMMSSQPECAAIFATHDPDIVPHTIEL